MKSIKTELAHGIQVMDGRVVHGGRIIPTRFEMIPEKEEGHKTVFVIDQVNYNKPIPDIFFSKQNMKKYTDSDIIKDPFKME